MDRAQAVDPYRVVAPLPVEELRSHRSVRTVIKQTGVIGGRPGRVLDSTVLDDAVATQDTVTQLVPAIRRVLRVVPGAEAPTGGTSGRSSAETAPISA